jgi:hypothetical protein
MYAIFCEYTLQYAKAGNYKQVRQNKKECFSIYESIVAVYPALKPFFGLFFKGGDGGYYAHARSKNRGIPSYIIHDRRKNKLNKIVINLLTT